MKNTIVCVIALLVIILSILAANFAPLKLLLRESYRDAKGNGIPADPSVTSERLFMFADNSCSPSCCPGQFSCSGGCICLTQQQKDALSQRGNNAKNQDEII